MNISDRESLCDGTYYIAALLCCVSTLRFEDLKQIGFPFVVFVVFYVLSLMLPCS